MRPDLRRPSTNNSHVAIHVDLQVKKCERRRGCFLSEHGGRHVSRGVRTFDNLD